MSITSLLVVAAIASAPARDSPSELLERANSRYAALEFEMVLAVADAVLSHADSDSNQRMDAYWLLGSALVALGNPVKAEKPFRFLLRGRPDFEAPQGTSPKIVAVFRKVQAEDREARTEVATLARARLLGSIALIEPLPVKATGGLPFELHVRVTDPSGAVAAAELRHRKDPAAEFSALALRRDLDGSWTGTLPAEWTDNDHGLDAQIYLVTLDRAGEPLFVSHDPSSPGVLRLTPGGVGDHAPFYQRPWFWIVSGAAAVAMAGGGWYAYDRSQPTDSPGGIWRLE